MDDLITLVGETFAQNEIGEQIATETRTAVWAHLRSVSASEYFAGGKIGLQPDIVAITPVSNYNGEKIVEYNGKGYAVYRTYFPENSDDIELYLEVRTGLDAGDQP